MTVPALERITEAAVEFMITQLSDTSNDVM